MWLLLWVITLIRSLIVQQGGWENRRPSRVTFCDSLNLRQKKSLPCSYYVMATIPWDELMVFGDYSYNSCKGLFRSFFIIVLIIFALVVFCRYLKWKLDYTSKFSFFVNDWIYRYLIVLVVLLHKSFLKSQDL